jgi:hypothetical protein
VSSARAALLKIGFPGQPTPKIQDRAHNFETRFGFKKIPANFGGR